MEFLEPIKGVVNKEIADDAASGSVEVDGFAPGCVVAFSEKLRRVGAQIITFRAKVVVDDVKKNHQPTLVRSLDEIFQVFGAAIDRVGGKGKYAVISPVALAGEIGKRHQFESGDADIDEIVETLDHTGEGSRGAKCADVEFVDDRVLPRSAAPICIAPVEGSGIDDLTWAMHIARLEARGRVGHAMLAVDAKEVVRTGLGLVGDEFEPSIFASV